MTARPVHIIILTWNGLHFTRRCLDTLRQNSAFPDYRVVVVDNGSTDGTLEYLRGRPWVTLLENGANLGFVQGNNRALARTPADADVVLMNNDIEVHQPDWLHRLQQAAYRAADIGIVGCRLRRPNGVLQHAGTYMPPSVYWGQQVGANEKDLNQYSADREVEGVVFACVYLKRAVLEAVGLLDADYFSYFEDTDYCLKAKQQGYKTVCCGSVTLEHHERASTAVNQVSHNKLFLASQKTFRRKWEAHLEAGRYHRRLAWHSILNFPTGYAISSKQLVLALDRHGVQVNYRYVYGPGTVFAVPEPTASDNFLIELIRKRPPATKDIQVVYGQGDVFQSNFGAYRVGFTMLETDGLPAEWVRQANLMDEVWVPSSFNVATFRASGVTRPIYIIPLGIDPYYFHPKITSYRNPDVFTFLTVFDWGERKAPEILLSAFCDEFSAREEVVLVCKVIHSAGKAPVLKQIEAMNLRQGGGRIILSVNDIIPSYQLGSLYRSADCFVLSSRGEGWGMPILEAMACGLPVIATNWGAQTDFFNETNGYPIDVARLVAVQSDHPYYRGLRWAEPSYEHLREQMRHVYQHRTEAQNKGLFAATEARIQWTWDHSARKILERLGHIEQSLSRGRQNHPAA